jgi:hypothetical protein
MKYLWFSGLIVLFVTLLAGGYWLQQTLVSMGLSRMILDYLQAQKSQVAASELMPGVWQRLCVIPSNYNPLSQQQIDEVLGQKNLVLTEWLGVDGNDLYVVSYSPQPKLQRYTAVVLNTQADAECTRGQNSLVKLSMYGEIPMMTPLFPERYFATP